MNVRCRVHRIFIRLAVYGDASRKLGVHTLPSLSVVTDISATDEKESNCSQIHLLQIHFILLNHATNCN
jgi:hypothetical protein